MAPSRKQEALSQRVGVTRSSPRLVFSEVPEVWEHGRVKTTIELPDITFRRAKALAAVHGITMGRFITEAVEQQLRKRTVAAGTATGSEDTTADPHSEPPWMAGFGGLSDLGDEHRLVLDAIEEEFERLAPDDIP